MTENGRNQIIMVHSMFFALNCLALAILVIWFLIEKQAIGKIAISIMAIIPLLLAVLHRRAKIGLREAQGKGIKLSFWLAILLLFGFPIGTLAGASILANLFEKPKIEEA